MDNGIAIALELQRMPDGGYVVSNGRNDQDFGFGRGPLFACTTIDEALDYMRSKIKPAMPQQGSDYSKWLEPPTSPMPKIDTSDAPFHAPASPAHGGSGGEGR